MDAALQPIEEDNTLSAPGPCSCVLQSLAINHSLWPPCKRRGGGFPLRESLGSFRLSRHPSAGAEEAAALAGSTGLRAGVHACGEDL